MPKQTMESFKGAKPLKIKRTEEVIFNDVTYSFQIDKNGAIYDMTPRIYDVFNRLHNRPFNREIVLEWLNSYAS